jgi:hypothetical protein
MLGSLVANGAPSGAQKAALKMGQRLPTEADTRTGSKASCRT